MSTNIVIKIDFFQSKIFWAFYDLQDNPGRCYNTLDIRYPFWILCNWNVK